MRKLLFLLLILLYGWGASGATLYLHFCCGRLADVEWEARQTNEPCHGEHIKKKSCCTEDVLASTVRDAHLAQDAASKLQVPFACPPSLHQWFLQPQAVWLQDARGVQELYAPPPLNRVDRSLLCIYRI